ncbi:hypothetical protein GCM10010522_24480 [Kribbella solani]
MPGQAVIVTGASAVPDTAGLIVSAYVPSPMYNVIPAASLLTPLTIVQYGVPEVPGPESEQLGIVRSTYKVVVAARAASEQDRTAPEIKATPPTRHASFMPSAWLRAGGSASGK